MARYTVGSVSVNLKNDIDKKQISQIAKNIGEELRKQDVELTTTSSLLLYDLLESCIN